LTKLSQETLTKTLLCTPLDREVGAKCMLNLKELSKTKKFVSILLLTLCVFAAISVQNQVAKAQDDSPLVILLPAEDTTYLAGVPMNVPVSGQWVTGCYGSAVVFFSLDGQDKIQIPAQTAIAPMMADITYADGTKVVAPSSLFAYFVLNTTVPLPALQAGSHSLTVYTTITFSGTKIYIENHQKTVSFTVNEQTPTNTPLPKTPTATSSQPTDNTTKPNVAVENSFMSVKFEAGLAVAAVASIAVISILMYHHKHSLPSKMQP
jgi:hypothetical protein